MSCACQQKPAEIDAAGAIEAGKASKTTVQIESHVKATMTDVRFSAQDVVAALELHAQRAAREPMVALAESAPLPHAEPSAMYEPMLALAEGAEGQCRMGGMGECAEPTGQCSPRSIRIERASYREGSEHEPAGFAFETLAEHEMSPKLQGALAERGRYIPCLPWVRVTRDPQRFKACMDGLRSLGQITNSKVVYEAVRRDLAKEDQEVFLVVLLDTQCYARGISEIARGARDRVAVGTPDVLRVAVVVGATAMIIVHNHPSGLVDPSPADREMTKGIVAAAAQVGIPVMDHIICGPTTYYSFADRGDLK